MSIYLRQRRYFEEAYRTGEHGWPVEEPSGFVMDFLKQGEFPRGLLRVLDMGCGEGRHTLLFAREGWQAVGVDYEPLAVKRAKVFAKRKGIRNGFAFVLGDIFHLPFPSQSFDVLIDYGVLHHVRRSDTQSYLRSVVPLLKPRGYFLLSCFSTRFKHHPGERRRRNWLVHRGHYDRFFKKSDFFRIFGGDFSVLRLEEERQECYAFYHLLLRKRGHA